MKNTTYTKLTYKVVEIDGVLKGVIEKSEFSSKHMERKFLKDVCHRDGFSYILFDPYVNASAGVIAKLLDSCKIRYGGKFILPE